MTDREDSEEIERAAAAWVVRLDRASPSPGDAAELETWLQGDTRRRGAYVRARAAWMLLDRGRALAGTSTVSPPARFAGLPRRALLVGGAAASVIVAVTGIGLVAPYLRRRPPQRFQTAFGDVRRVQLDDGSSAVLDTDSAIEVDFQPKVRHIKLERGEAWFQVAKDADRPFIVRQGTVEVRAVGTAFSVSTRTNGAAILVTEGVVELSSGPRQSQAPIRLQSGAQALMQDDGRARIEPVASEAMQRTLAWREGRLALDGESLLEATRAFNRYNAVKIAVDDPRLATERLVGWYDIKDPAGFADAVAISLTATAATRDGVIHLSSLAQIKKPG